MFQDEHNEPSKKIFFSHLFFLTFLGEISVKALKIKFSRMLGSLLWNFRRPEVMMGVDSFKVHLITSIFFFLSNWHG